MSKNVLITGGAGFIGYHLAKNLAESGYQVDLIDNLKRGVVDGALKELLDRPNVTLKNINVLDGDALDHLDKDYTFIYHLAAIIGVSNVLNRPYEVLQDNTLMLLKMIDFARNQKDLQRLIFSSTSEVYAGTLAHFQMQIPTPESTPLTLTALDHPRTSYMLSKLYGEALCQQSGVPFTIIRPHNIYGPRMGLSHVVPELLQKAHNSIQGEVLKVFSVDHMRSFCYIDDAVEMVKRMAESSDCNNQSLNLGNQSREYTIGEVAECIIKTVGKNLVIDPQPATPGSPVRRCPDMSLTTKLTGYEAQIDLEVGVQKTYEWYLAEIFSGSDVSAS